MMSSINDNTKDRSTVDKKRTNLKWFHQHFASFKDGNQVIPCPKLNVRTAGQFALDVVVQRLQTKLEKLKQHDANTTTNDEEDSNNEDDNDDDNDDDDDDSNVSESSAYSDEEDIEYEKRHRHMKVKERKSVTKRSLKKNTSTKCRRHTDDS